VRAIDTHFHWYPASIYERLSRREDYPRAVKVGNGYRYLYTPDQGGDRSPVWLDLEGGFAAADAASGPETTVVNTTGTFEGLVEQLPLDLALEVAADYNEQVAAAQRSHPGRFYGTAAIPLGDTREALALLDYTIGELGLVAVNLPALAGGEPIDVPRLQPFYARVAELGVPLIVHPTDTVFADALSAYNGDLFRAIGRTFDTSVTILRLIFSGTMERHPDLKVLHTHSGGLLPYQVGWIDKSPYADKGIASLPHATSDYIKRIYVDTVAPYPLTIRTAIEFYGIDNIVYGTDYPCWSCARSFDVLNGSELTEAQVAQILSVNATRLFRLEGLERFQPAASKELASAPA
jgi:aminocarboxymuconate-semialdehyde decarboxylase